MNPLKSFFNSRPMFWLSIHYKPILIVLTVFFVFIAGFIFLFSSQAAVYNAFCERNGYEMAGYMNNWLACLTINVDQNIVYRQFECLHDVNSRLFTADSCNFVFDENTIIIPPKNCYQIEIEGLNAN